MDKYLDLTRELEKKTVENEGDGEVDNFSWCL